MGRSNRRCITALPVGLTFDGVFPTVANLLRERSNGDQSNLEHLQRTCKNCPLRPHPTLGLEILCRLRLAYYQEKLIIPQFQQLLLTKIGLIRQDLIFSHE